MPLTDKETQAIKALVDYAKDDATRKEVAEAIRTQAQAEVFQPISHIGFAAGKAEGERGLTEMKTRAETAETKLTAAETKVKEYEKKAPDAEGIIAGLNTKIEQLETDKRTIRADSKRDLENALLDRDVASYEKELTSQGMDPRYAKSEGMLLRNRAKYVDGKLVVYTNDNDKIPVSTPPDGDLLKFVATETVKIAPPGVILSRTDSGSGTRSGNDTGSQSAGDQWESIRKEEDERAKRETAASGGIIGAFRPDVAGVAGAASR